MLLDGFVEMANVLSGFTADRAAIFTKAVKRVWMNMNHMLKKCFALEVR